MPRQTASTTVAWVKQAVCVPYGRQGSGAASFGCDPGGVGQHLGERNSCGQESDPA